jgi:hypothetical protein
MSEQDAPPAGRDNDPRVPLLVAAGIAAVFLPAVGLTAVTARALGRFARVPAVNMLAAVPALLLAALAVSGLPDPGRMLAGSLDAWKALLGDSTVGGADRLLGAGTAWAVLLGALAGIAWSRAAEGSGPDAQMRASIRAWWRGRALASRIRNGPGFADSVTLGVLADDPTTRVGISPSTANGHLLVTGATGAGKTVGVLSTLVDAAEQGNPVVYLDLKGDDTVSDYLAGVARKYQRPFQHFSIFESHAPYVGPSSSGPSSYNPAGYGDATRRKDLLTKACGSTVEFYLNMTADYVQVAFAVLLASDGIGTDSALAAIAKVMDPRALQRQARAIPADARLYEPLNRKAGEYVDGMRNREFMSSLKTFQTYLSLFINSSVGPYLTADGDVIDFAEVDRTSGIVVFSLNSSLYPDIAGRLATLIVEDITTYAGQRFGTDAKPFRLVVDEFSVIDSENLLGLISRGRAAGMCVTLATQTLADLESKSPAFRAQVLDNVAGFCVFRTNSEGDARTYSGLTGDIDAASGYEVPWQAFQRSDKGQCWYVNKTPATRKRRGGRTERERSVVRVNVIKRAVPAVPSYEHHLLGAGPGGTDSISASFEQHLQGDWLTPDDGESAAGIAELVAPARESGAPAVVLPVPEPQFAGLDLGVPHPAVDPPGGPAGGDVDAAQLANGREPAADPVPAPLGATGPGALPVIPPAPRRRR